ncbi:MAG: type II toxin-antitoxin system death-on-curing family toxin [Thermomicrobiales bacterium]
MVVYLAVAEVVEIHAQAMEAMGWAVAPLRSVHLLESAVMKAQMAAYYGGADLAEQAAVLAIGISQNQPFLDGNKLTAYVSLVTFLQLNGMSVSARNLEVAAQLIAVAERAGTLEEATAAFAVWLRERLAESPAST